MILSKKAFSLIEVLSSILLLAGLISIVVQLSYGNTRRIRKSRQLEKIAQLLEFKMLQLKEEFKGKNTVSLPQQDEGNFEKEESYSWAYQTQALKWPNTETLLFLTRIPDNEWNRKILNTLNGVLSDTVVELKLTVSYQQKKGKTLSYSLSSYFINYEDAPDFIFNRISELLPAQGQSL